MDEKVGVKVKKDKPVALPEITDRKVIETRIGKKIKIVERITYGKGKGRFVKTRLLSCKKPGAVKK